MANEKPITLRSRPSLPAGLHCLREAYHTQVPTILAGLRGTSLPFEIDTPGGAIRVEYGYRCFECHGTADALAAHGLIALDWLPGLEGNNRIQQTVAFGRTGAYLIFGNRRGGRLDVPSITISRVSRTTYVVLVPPTPEQKAWGEAVWKQLREEGWKRRLEERCDGGARRGGNVTYLPFADSGGVAFPGADPPSPEAIRLAHEVLYLPPQAQAHVRRFLVRLRLRR